jgi:conjugal transfer/type IV secretion protein DotA/TraY
MVTKTDIAKYTLLPGILPRFMEFFRSGFAHVAYLLAVIYQGVRLLPAGHSYLDPQNFGQFGIRHVIAAAANNLVLKRQNFDQIFVFVVLLVGIFMLFAQMALFIFTLTLGQPALAAAALDAATMFGRPAAGTGQDIAAILLDRVFGVPGFFDSCISNTSVACMDMTNSRIVMPAATPFPWPFHVALHRMFQFYSHGIFAIAVFVLIYFIITIVAETAQSGTPFGQRFNKTWAPIRLILFLALLLPISSDTATPDPLDPTAPVVRVEGLNGAQLILLKVVQLGSHFATNGWIYFTDQIAVSSSESYLMQQKKMIATPNSNVTDIKKLLQFIAVAKTCREGYNLYRSDDDGGTKDVQAYVVRTHIPTSYGAVPGGVDAVRNNAQDFSALPAYTDATAFTALGDIVVRFGVIGDDVSGEVDKRYRGFVGNVEPLCGDLTIRTIGNGQPGALKIQEEYYKLVQEMWYTDTVLNDHAQCIVKRLKGQNLTCSDTFKETDIKARLEHYIPKFETAIGDGISEQEVSGMFDLSPEIKARGWAGAALWYNKISEMNGAITLASFNIPQPSKLPFLMEKAFREQNAASSNVLEEGKFSTELSNHLGYRVAITFKDQHDKNILDTMTKTYEIWSDSKAADAGSLVDTTGNVFLDFVNIIFGTQGIFEMRKNTDVHPLGQLSALGRGMMDAVVRNLAIASATEMGGKTLKMFSQFSDAHAKAAGGFFFSMVATTMSMAIILYYVLPIMPFLYFLFAVSGWLKSIFEAMVAMPLWALGHLRIDGEGMMGPGAMNGYFLLLEIFLRPMLILVGMVTSLATFSALVGVLNLIFDQVVSNVGGFDNKLDAEIRGGAPGVSQLDSVVSSVDEFFFTAMYVIICYMMALSSFKLVDTIPNKILRWMGAQMPTFQENAGDPVGKLGSQVQRGGLLVTNQLRGRSGTADAPLL